MTASHYDLDLAVIGGGASGFFTAIQYAEISPNARVSIFEKSPNYLQKVRISGGGRCNVTHACFQPKDLSKFYPRGEKELHAAFHRWQASDTVEWFRQHGVELIAEADGRMFPSTHQSETIIHCFLNRASHHHIQLCSNQQLTHLAHTDDGGFSLGFNGSESRITARSVCIATGSLKDSPLLSTLKKLDQTIESPVPSLFAFNVVDPRLHELAGVSHPKVSARLNDSQTSQTGPILITHRGLSGPAILRLSAWEARATAAKQHRFTCLIDWLPDLSRDALLAHCSLIRQDQGAKLLRNTPISPIPRRLWEKLIAHAEISADTTWSQLPKKSLLSLIEILKASAFQVNGKTTNKDEFVTAGGITRKSIDFRTMQSKNTPGLFFAGECIDIDGITGGFNFQAAWTTAHVAATAIAQRPSA